MAQGYPGGRKVQDDSREAALARMLNLRHSEERTGPDAWDEHDNPYELKTTTKGGVGTGRDVSHDYLDGLLSRYLVVARGRQTTYGFSFEDVYILHPDDLSEWAESLRSKILADEAIIEPALDAYRATGASEEALTRLEYLCNRGKTYNNPKIPWRYIEEHGAKLGTHPELDVREFVAQRPLTSGASSSGASDVDPPSLRTHSPSAWE